MEIKTLVLGILGVNCYLISGEEGAVVIDPGYKSQEITDFLKNNSEKDRLIILTHNHFDHIGFAADLSELTDTKIAISEYENAGLSDPSVNLSANFAKRMKAPVADILLKDGDNLKIGDIEFEVIHTPGHTVGGISLLSGDKLFSGDTLFYQSIGRTDFPGGSFNTLKNSVLRLYDLDGNITVYPGHGPTTTIADEKQSNPYIKEN